jgi:hypothetical protein
MHQHYVTTLIVMRHPARSAIIGVEQATASSVAVSWRMVAGQLRLAAGQTDHTTALASSRQTW